jgi:hypothetical protein
MSVTEVNISQYTEIQTDIVQMVRLYTFTFHNKIKQKSLIFITKKSGTLKQIPDVIEEIRNEKQGYLFVICVVVQSV